MMVSFRGQRGVIAVTAPLIIIVILMLSALMLDGARLYSAHSALQAQANIAATAAAGKANTCNLESGSTDMQSAAQAAMAMMAKQQGRDIDGQTISVQTGVISSDESDKVSKFVPENDFMMTNGVAVEIERKERISMFLPKMFGEINLNAKAAAKKEVYATFYTDSYTAQLSTADSPLLQPIFQYVLGDNQLTLKALSLQELSNTVVDLADIVNELVAENLVLGNLGLDYILGSEVPAYVVVGLLKGVDGLSSDTVALLDEVVDGIGVDTTIKLEDVITVLGDSSVDSGAKIPLLELVSGIVLDLAQQPPFNGVIPLSLTGLTGPLGLDENLILDLELTIDQAAKPVVAPARMVMGSDGAEWMGIFHGADISLRLVAHVNIGDSNFSVLKLSVPLELSTGASTARLVGASCASGLDNAVAFDFEVERSLVKLSTIHDGVLDGIQLQVLAASEPPEEVCFPAVLDRFCPDESRDDVTWTYKYRGLFGEEYGDCCYPPVNACGSGLVDIRISSSPEGGGFKEKLETPYLSLGEEWNYEKDLKGNNSEVLIGTIQQLLDGLNVDQASVACLPLDGLVNGLVDGVITPTLTGLLEPLTDYLLAPLIEALGVNLGTATLHVIAAEQPAVQLLEYCGPEGC